MRRIASIIVSAVVASATVAAPAVAAGPDSQSVSVAAKKTKPAKPPKACRKRLAKPKKVVPSKRFAKCVVKAMVKGRTAHLSSRFSDGSGNQGDARFKKNYTETSASYSDGSRLVVLGGKAWFKPAGHGWVKAKNKGTPNEQLAWNIQQLWVGLSSARAYKAYLRASSSGWKPTGRNKGVNGVTAREYVGTVTIEGLTHDDYRVWVDKWDRPIRINSTLTAYGSTITGVQNFKKWGKNVKIKKPKLG
ncbi:hypothetical protein [Nocardioides alcanivorans]|uniref:hypothetical protein n=1 Tax=Nocardioides alcanivorans TaxID=2897352 RepID=UPI001F2DFBA8|nr:hypothetical protein [Nocardioides alcanivorans]